MTPYDTWKPTLDPMDPNLYGGSNDVTWYKGNDILHAFANDRTLLRERMPWFVDNWNTAKAMIRKQSAPTIRILSALASWRCCTTDQLADGLTAGPIPPFTRDEPNLWGALCRLGVLTVGFSGIEAMSGRTVPHVWVAVTLGRTDTDRVLRRAGVPAWLTRCWANSEGTYLHRHAYHNTTAAHLGLTLARHPQARWTCGDAWCRFVSVDPEAAADAHVSVAAGGDVAALLDNNALFEIEVQSSLLDVPGKMDRWMRMLAASPMSRRGLGCVWMLIPRRGTVIPADAGERLEAMIREHEEAAIPEVAARIGWARWDDWYDHRGRPAERFGLYRDANGNTRSMFDPMWAQFMPAHVLPLDEACAWGWRQARERIASWWGFDPRMWAMPMELRGGFNGFAGREATDVIPAQPKDNDEEVRSDG